MSYLGSWKIDDNLTFAVVTTRFDTGAATDADAAPAYRVYEDETATPILTGTMALLDSTNTAGFYSEQIALSAANGFEKGKSYNVYISATVNSVAGATTRNFQIEAEVDANIVSDKTGYGLADSAITSAKFAAGAIDAAAIANGAIDAATFAADVDAEILSYIVDDATRIDASALNTAAVTTIPAILTDTAEIGAAGAGLTEAGGTGDHLTAIPWNASWDAEVQSEVTDALNAYDPPTRAELTSDIASLAQYIDTEVAAILEDTGTTLDGKIDTIDTVVDAIKVQTDKLTFTVANQVDANVQYINDAALTGDGSATPWGPA